MGSSATVRGGRPCGVSVISAALARRVPERQRTRWSTVAIASGARSSRRPAGATLPLACQRRPSPSSLTAKCVQRSSKWIRAHSPQDSGGPPAGPPRGAALGCPDGTHAPRAIPRAGRAIGEDGDLLVAEADVPLPEPELGEAGEIHQHPALGPVREARLLDRTGAGVEGEIGGEP